MVNLKDKQKWHTDKYRPITDTYYEINTFGKYRER